MWTDDEMNDYSAWLARMDLEITNAIAIGARTVDDVIDYVDYKLDGIIDSLYIKSSYKDMTSAERS